MKEELATTVIFEEVQSHDQCDPVVAIQASEIEVGSESKTVACVQGSENSSSSSMLKGSIVNGFIVYTRVKKSRPSCNGFYDNGNVKRFKRAEEMAANALSDSGNPVGVDKADNKMEIGVDCSKEELKCNVLKRELAQSIGSEGNLYEVPVVVYNNSDFLRDVVDRKTFRRYTRSASKSKVESSEKQETASEAVPIENSKPEGKVSVTVLNAPSTTAGNKLELKMSKKILLDKKPVTVRELFETGLLEGVPVIYMGGMKFDGLRGIIQDGGILCSCCLCNDRRVIPPSQFEIHAAKQYRRAAQYICLENGKSLLELLRACRTAPLHTLEATIQSIVSSPPEKKYFTCKRCKECFPSSSVARIGPLCNSCVKSKGGKPKDSVDSSMETVGKRVRSPKPTLVSQPASTSKLCISPNVHIAQSSKLSISPQVRSHWKKRTESSKGVNSSESSTSASVPILSQKKNTSASVPILSRKKNLWKMKKKSSKVSVKLKTPKTTSSSKCLSSTNKSQWRITKKDWRLHRLVFEEGGLPDGTEVAYYGRGQKLLEGYKKGFGIFCRCCNTEVSPSQFEVHAGWASRRKPYAYIYTSNGVSLHELAVSLSKGRKYSAKDNDDLCIICWDGGNLLLCDGCPRAFHKECASLTLIPRGDWYCKFCQNMFQREKFLAHNANALAAGRVEGVDPIKEITQRCIRIVKNIDADMSGCALCGGYDFSRSGFGPRTIILCDQCEKEYHVGCLRDHKMAYLKELPEGDWFCCIDCTRINSTLQNLLVRGAEKLPDSLLHVLKNKQEEKGLEFVNDIDVRWQLLNGKIASPQTRPMLSEAVAIFHECFDPIVDVISGRDLIPAMVYGRNVRGQEFGGMYCAILMVNSSVVSAGMLRIFGTDVAELPLVATSKVNHGKGYFQLLFACIERLLAFLNVKNLVLPAAEEAKAIWTEKFGFNKMNPEELINYRKQCHQMVTFKGTSMLQKMVPPCRLTNNNQS